MITTMTPDEVYSSFDGEFAAAQTLDELLDVHARRHRAFLAAGGHYPPLHDDDDDSYAERVWRSFSEEFHNAETMDELLDIHARRQWAYREALAGHRVTEINNY